VKSLPKNLVSVFTAIWLILVMTTLSSQLPIRAKERNSNHDIDIFYSTLKSPLIGEKEIIVARSYSRRKRYNSYVATSYDYWDAKLIGMYFQQSTYESKLWIGNKFLFMPHNEARYTVNEVLGSAYTQYLMSTSFNNPSTFRLYNDAFGYNDAVLLARFWSKGRRVTANQIMQSKYKIDQTLARGNDEYIRGALEQAKSLYSY
jgi:hypothetical protein